MNNFESIGNVENLVGKRVFVRADFNVPIKDGKVADDFRIKKTLPLLSFLRKQGAKIILSSHIAGSESDSLAPVYRYLASRFQIKNERFEFVPDYFPNRPSALSDLGADIVLLENLRKYKEEEANDENFSKHLSSFADIYVNEAFSVSHRPHASIVGIPRHLPRYAGLLFEQEVKNLSESFDPPRPFLFILGGAKFETKITLLKKFLVQADYVFVGGALANNIFKARGKEIGKSRVSEKEFDIGDIIDDSKMTVPVDVVVKNQKGSISKAIEQVLPDETIMDAGPQSLSMLQTLLLKSKFVLWNGPLGNYELGYKMATHDLARAIAQSRRRSIVGGGDTLAAIHELNLFSKFSFVSTGGGAMLDFLADGTLVGLDALKK